MILIGAIKMKKILALLLVLTMTMTLLVGCGSNADKSNTPSSDNTVPQSNIDISNVKLISDGVLSVGVEIGYPPFEFYAEDGVTPVGFDVDIATAIAETLGLKVNFVDTAWDGIFQGIGVNYDVVISAASITPLRKETMDFSNPYITNYQAIVVPADSDLTFGALTDLSGYSVSMQKETNSDIILDDLIGTGSVTDCVPVTNEKVTTCFEQLTNGEVDVVLCDSSVADGYVAKSPELYKIAYLDEAEAEQFGVALKKGDTAMADVINAALAQLEASGYLADSTAKWFG